MKAFDLHRMAFDKVPFDFLGEVALRSLYTFVLVFLFLKMTGRRGVRQMSLFEVLIILTLGSAAGDVAFYDDVPMVPVLIVFITLALLYRLVMWLMAHSEKLEDRSARQSSLQPVLRFQDIYRRSVHERTHHLSI